MQKNRKCFVGYLLLWVAALAVSCLAADQKVETINPLSKVEQKLVDSIVENFRIPACDSVSLVKSLNRKAPCPMAVHLQPFVTWIVQKGKGYKECIQDCSTRCMSLGASKQFEIDYADMPIAGEIHAPVSIVVYISALCPLCKYLTTAVYREVTSGALKGKATLCAKPFTNGLGDRALLAAAHYKKFWEYISALQNIKMRPDEPILLSVADSLGLPKNEFKRLLTDTTYTKKLEEFRAEGQINEVTLTPTFFIKGKRYRSYKDPQWLVDAALYEYEKQQKSK